MGKLDEEIEKFSREIKKAVDARKEYNDLILKKITEMLEDRPYIRFCQLLCNLGIGSVNLFSEEPCVTYEKILKIDKMWKEDAVKEDNNIDGIN